MTLDLSSLTAADAAIQAACEDNDPDLAEQLLEKRKLLVETLRTEAARLDELAQAKRERVLAVRLKLLEEQAEEELAAPPVVRLPQYRMWRFTGLTSRFDTATGNILGGFCLLDHFRYCYYRVDYQTTEIDGFVCFTHRVTESTLAAAEQRLDYKRCSSISAKKEIEAVDKVCKGKLYVFGSMPRFNKRRLA